MSRHPRGPAEVSSNDNLPDGIGLFALQALEGRLRRILKVDVDLAPTTSLKPRVRVEAEAEAIRL